MQGYGFTYSLTKQNKKVAFWMPIYISTKYIQNANKN